MPITTIKKKFSLGNKFSIDNNRKHHLNTILNQYVSDDGSYNIIWIKEKAGTYKVDFNTFKISESTLFFLAPGQRFSHISGNTVASSIISFTQDFHCLEKHNSDIACNGILFNNQENISFIEIEDEQIASFEIILNNIIKEFRSEAAAKSDMILSYFRMFLVESVRIKLRQKMVQEKDLSEELKIISLFNRLVELHFKKCHNVSDYANMIGISPKSISKTFNKEGKNKPSIIIKNRIILEAKRELLYSESSVKEICFKLGFDDPAYFSRLFKKQTNQTPLEFKNSAV